MATQTEPGCERATGLDSTRLEHRASANAWARYVPLAVWAIVILTLLVVPLKIISYGFIPADDARRYAAKAVSGKAWHEILVFRDGVPRDHNPGWNVILERLHGATGWQADALVTFSVLSLFGVFALAALPWLRRPESWLIVLLTFEVCAPGQLGRLFLGRPYILSMAAQVLLLLFWRPGRPVSSPAVILSIGVFGTVVWVHGSWYLLVLMPAAFYLAGQVRQGHALLGSWAAGSFLGALATGHPVRFLADEVNIPLRSFGNHVLTRMLVSEFQPGDGAYTLLVAVALVLVGQHLAGYRLDRLVTMPAFVLAAGAWLLAFKVSRFWSDWGVPALLVWFTWQVESQLSLRMAADSPRRLALAAFVALALFWSTTSDLSSRWSYALTMDYLEEGNPELAGWLPAPGGIIYSSDMGAFYNTFFKNPRAPWRYLLGFEPTFMPEDDLATFRHIQWNRGAWKAYQPWVAKMRPEDRMVLYATAGAEPRIDGLEWHYSATDTWIGRRPRGGPPAISPPLPAPNPSLSKGAPDAPR